MGGQGVLYFILLMEMGLNTQLANRYVCRKRRAYVP